MRKWTVYIHKIPNGKVYVGITSYTVNQRWKRGSGYRNNVYFKRAIDKYGWENIQHLILFEDLYEDVAKEYEMFLISILQSNNPLYGYNHTLGGDGTLGFRHSQDSIKKTSDANRGKHINVGEQNGMYGKLPPRTKRILCVTTGVEYVSMKEASICNNIASGCLSRALRKGIPCKGLEWREITWQML